MKRDAIAVTIPTAAEHVGVSERTVRRWITARMLSSYRTKNGTRVVLIDEVIDLERRVRRAPKGGRARLRADYFEALRELSSEPVGRT